MDSPFLAALRTAQTILVAVHVRPDGDAIASLGATVSILRDNGFHAFGILPELPSKALAAFLPAEGILQSAEGIEADVFITADCSKPDRVAAGGYPFEHCPTLINIDHHPDNPGFGTLNLVASDAAACTENLYTLFRDAGFRICKENATRLLLGLITDSGCFRFQNTSPDAFRTAASKMPRVDGIGVGTHGTRSGSQTHHRLHLQLASGTLRPPGSGVRSEPSENGVRRKVCVDVS